MTIGTFDSATALIEAGATCGRRGARAMHHEVMNGQFSLDWLGLPSYERATYAPLAAMVANGWTEGADKLSACIASTDMPTMTNVRRRARWMDQGDEIDMDSVRSGNLDTAWRAMNRRSVSSPPRVLLVLDSIANGGMDAERMFWRGAAACILSESMQAAGYVVTVVSAFRGNEDILRVIVKPPTAQMDLATAAACLAWPGFFRYFGHLWGTATEGCTNAVGWRVHELRPADVADIDDTSRLLIVPQSIDSPEAAQAFINNAASLVDAAAAGDMS